MSDHATHRLLGELIAKIGVLEDALKESETRSRDSRERVYGQLESIRADVSESRRRLDVIDSALDDEIRPVVSGVLDWRSRALGAVMVLGFIGTLIVLALTAAKELLLDIWRLMVSR